MGCSQGLARILVFVANFAFLLAGLALLALGIFYKLELTNLTNAIPEAYSALQHVPTLAIVVGVIIFVIAFLGCCGALRNNTCMLSWYGAILVIIFLAQVGIGIFALVQIKDKGDLEGKLRAEFRNLVNSYYNRPASQEVVDFIQHNLKCCGTISPASWGTNTPSSCFVDYDRNKEKFAEGCDTVFPEFVSRSIKIIAIVAIVISATEIFGAVLALCLAGCIRGSRRQGAYY